VKFRLTDYEDGGKKKIEFEVVTFVKMRKSNKTGYTHLEIMFF